MIPALHLPYSLIFYAFPTQSGNPAKKWKTAKASLTLIPASESSFFGLTACRKSFESFRFSVPFKTAILSKPRSTFNPPPSRRLARMFLSCGRFQFSLPTNALSPTLHPRKCLRFLPVLKKFLDNTTKINYIYLVYLRTFLYLIVTSTASIRLFG
jgi:hypothetical protein